MYGEQEQKFALHHGRQGSQKSVDRLAAMPEQTTHPETQSAQIAALREENLRLRDQLMARDTEIGLMRGQVVELEAGAVRALHLLRRVKAILMPGIVLRVLTRVSRLAKRA